MNCSMVTTLAAGRGAVPIFSQCGAVMQGAYPPGQLMPVTTAKSPGEGCTLLTLSTKTPPLESCTKNLPFQLGSAAVTTPLTEILIQCDACSAESERTSAAFVKTSFVCSAETICLMLKRPSTT